MSETMTTTLGAVLSHTTGILLADIDEVFPLQDFVIGRPLWTHERGTSYSENNIAAPLLAQFPALAEAHPPKITTRAEAEAWVASVSEHTGVPLTVEVAPRASAATKPLSIVDLCSCVGGPHGGYTCDFCRGGSR